MLGPERVAPVESLAYRLLFVAFFARKSSPRTCPNRSSFAAVAKSSRAFARQLSARNSWTSGAFARQQSPHWLDARGKIDTRDQDATSVAALLIFAGGPNLSSSSVCVVSAALAKNYPPRPTELPVALISNASSAKRLPTGCVFCGTLFAEHNVQLCAVNKARLSPRNRAAGEAPVLRPGRFCGDLFLWATLDSALADSSELSLVKSILAKL